MPEYVSTSPELVFKSTGIRTWRIQAKRPKSPASRWVPSTHHPHLNHRKVTAPVLFDETPIGLRRRRTMAGGLARLETLVANSSLTKQTGTPTLDIIAAVVALDYLRFRFPDATWMPTTRVLNEFAKKWRARASLEIITPR